MCGPAMERLAVAAALTGCSARGSYTALSHRDSVMLFIWTLDRSLVAVCMRPDCDSRTCLTAGLVGFGRARFHALASIPPLSCSCIPTSPSSRPLRPSLLSVISQSPARPPWPGLPSRYYAPLAFPRRASRRARSASERLLLNGLANQVDQVARLAGRVHGAPRANAPSRP